VNRISWHPRRPVLVLLRCAIARLLLGFLVAFYKELFKKLKFSRLMTDVESLIHVLLQQR